MGKQEEKQAGATVEAYLGLGVVWGLGLVMGAAEIWHMEKMSTDVGVTVFALLPFVFNIALIGAGYGLWKSQYDGDEILRIAGGVVLGTVVLGLLATWTITHQNVRGLAFAHGPFVTVSNMSAGATVGFLLGWYNVQGRRYRQTVAEDRARLEELNQSLEEKNQKLERFASILSHDLRNPLNIAMGWVDQLRAERDNEELSATATALDRMEEIIANVRTLARQGQSIDDVETVPLSSMARQSWLSVRSPDAELVVDDELTLESDPARLRQLLENLFRNAIDHGRSDVTVWVGALDGSSGFYVEDDGVGIHTDDRDELFEWGYSATQDTTGFGLAIVKEVADAHGWTVEVTDGEAGGARFEIAGVNQAAPGIPAA